MKFTGFKNKAIKTKTVVNNMQTYKGVSVCYENGIRLWQETSKIIRLSKLDAIHDAQNISSDKIKSNFLNNT